VTLYSLLGARRGHFRYESGHHGELWLDLDGLFVRPRRLDPFIAALAAALPAVDVLCGPLVGGAFVAQLLAARLDVDCCYTARTGASYRVPGYRLPGRLAERLAGRRVAVVDDAINAGSAVGATLAAVRSAGGEPVAVGALLVLGSAVTAVAGALPVHAVERVDAPLWSAVDCPLCTDRVPLTDLASMDST
jgi:orotate phosphoribosyltransferase